MLMDRQNSTLLVVDVQERLLPAIADGEAVLANGVWLVGVARRLGVPVVISEQYPEGLGRTAGPLLAAAGDASIVTKTHFSCVSDGCLAGTSADMRRQVVVVGHLIMIYICWLVYQGSMAQVKINMEVLAPSSQLPLAIVYFAGVFFAISGGVMLLLDLWLLFTGRVADDQLVMIQESEDVAALQHATHDAPKPR